MISIGDEVIWNGERTKVSYIDWSMDQVILESPSGSVYRVPMDKVLKIPTLDSNPYTVCECGAEITYGKDTQFHAQYCPKYKKPEIT